LISAGAALLLLLLPACLQDVRLPESSIHDFARDMVVALQFLHANSIIYCDIKPSNILLDENGRLKLGGFGLSRRLSDINKNPVTNLPPVSACVFRGGVQVGPGLAGLVECVLLPGMYFQHQCSCCCLAPHLALMVHGIACADAVGSQSSPHSCVWKLRTSAWLTSPLVTLRCGHVQAKRGTPCYMAPELFSEGATHSTASDLWSLGCVLYECATGRPPFMDSSFNQLAHDILHNDPAAIPGAASITSMKCMSRAVDV
jgi:serine/threonine protein kinase